MPVIGVSIVKSTSFRGTAQEFGNTYYYEVVNPPNTTVANEIIDALVTKEKAQHSTNINFVRAKAWTAGGTQQQNNMLVQKNLTGTGSLTPAQVDKERAFLVRFRAGNDSRGRPVYLRKWWHLDVSVVGGTQVSTAQIQQTAQLTTAQRDALKAFGNDIKSLTLVTQGFTAATLCGPNGRAITGDTDAHPYYEHHQLGDMWR
jgi:hypothetical protein